MEQEIHPDSLSSPPQGITHLLCATGAGADDGGDNGGDVVFSRDTFLNKGSDDSTEQGVPRRSGECEEGSRDCSLKKEELALEGGLFGSRETQELMMEKGDGNRAIGDILVDLQETLELKMQKIDGNQVIDDTLPDSQETLELKIEKIDGNQATDDTLLDLQDTLESKIEKIDENRGIEFDDRHFRMEERGNCSFLPDHTTFDSQETLESKMETTDGNQAIEFGNRHLRIEEGGNCSFLPNHTLFDSQENLESKMEGTDGNQTIGDGHFRIEEGGNCSFLPNANVFDFQETLESKMEKDDGNRVIGDSHFRIEEGGNCSFLPSEGQEGVNYCEVEGYSVALFDSQETLEPKIEMTDGNQAISGGHFGIEEGGDCSILPYEGKEGVNYCETEGYSDAEWLPHHTLFDSQETLDSKIEKTDGNQVIGDSHFGIQDGGNCSFLPSEGCYDAEWMAIAKRDEILGHEIVEPAKIGEDHSLTCSLKIEVIDGTALVDIAKFSRNSKGIGGENEGKRPKRRPRNAKKSLNSINMDRGAASRKFAMKGDGSKLMYTRKELEGLRFLNVKGQKKKWREVYNGLALNVRKEYDELVNFRRQKRGGSSLDPHHQVSERRNNGAAILGESSSQDGNCDAGVMSSIDIACSENSSDMCNSHVDGDWSDDDESDDEGSIQRPAFLVEGEPDFDSGPPEDGLEYLRRVRWEAEQIPKVKVAKLDRKMVEKEQSVYMPKIPDVEKCPEHLIPLKHWEDDFLAEFSELRLAISRLEEASNTPTDEPETIIFSRNPKPVHPARSSKKTIGADSGPPTLSVLLEMDPVSRAALLRRHIDSLESLSELSKNDCAWLFALCAVVDTPLDADTTASLRCLLRKCAKLRAGKLELDNEVVMLNILSTISGKFFGQCDK